MTLSSAGLIPFNGTEPIVLLFVGGKFSSGAGFSLRGRQIPCAEVEEINPRVAEAVIKQPHLGRRQISRNKRVPLSGMMEAEAEWLNLRVGDEDLVLDWVGPEGHITHQLTQR